MKMRADMWQTTFNLAWLSHYDNSDHNAESIYNITLQETNGRAIQASKHEFNGIVLHIYEALASRRRSLKSFP